MTGEKREFYDEHQPDGSCCFEVVRAVLVYHGLWRLVSLLRRVIGLELDI